MISAPFRIKKGKESYAIEAGDGRCVAYIYYCDENARRQAMRRLTSAEAEEMAKVMAGALRDRYGDVVIVCESI